MRDRYLREANVFPRLAGVQCKDKDGRLGSVLKQSELTTICGDATKFVPTLATLSIATTAPNDAKIQKKVRSLNAAKTFPFEVALWSWNEIEEEVVCRPNILAAFYPGFRYNPVGDAVHLSAYSPHDQFFAFFSRPQFDQIHDQRLRSELFSVAYEVCDNAFRHGSATNIALRFDGSTLTVEDDGKAFNPLADLDPSRATARSHVGSLIVDRYIQRNSSRMKAEYVRSEVKGKKCNALHIVLVDLVGEDHGVMDISVNVQEIFGRQSAERYAASLFIPPGIRELVLTVEAAPGTSASSALIECVRNRLPESALLVISHARYDPIGDLKMLFDEQKVLFRSR